MGFFEKKIKFSKPVKAPQYANGEIVFPGTNIWVNNVDVPEDGGRFKSAFGQTGPIVQGEYAPTVLNHLKQIQGFTAGHQLIAAIAGLTNRKVVIAYAGPNNNSARGQKSAGLSRESDKKLRQYEGTGRDDQGIGTR